MNSKRGRTLRVWSYIERMNNSSKVDLGDVSGVVSEDEESYLDVLLNNEVFEYVHNKDENSSPSNYGIFR